MEYRSVMFAVAIAHLLEDRWRGIGSSRSFEEILRNRSGVNLHRAWETVRGEGRLGEFAEEFPFDPLYGVSDLEEALHIAAVTSLGIRLGGTDLCYHADVLDKNQVRKVLSMSKIPENLVLSASMRLNQLLEEQESGSSPARA